jgi:hypothetical protein
MVKNEVAAIVELMAISNIYPDEKLIILFTLRRWVNIYDHELSNGMYVFNVYLTTFSLPQII